MLSLMHVNGHRHLFRLIVPFALMIVAVVALSGWLIYQSAETAARKQQLESLSADARLMARQIDTAGPVVANASVDLAAFARERGLRITIIEASGRVAFDTASDAASMENHNDRIEVITARKNGSGSSVRKSHTLGESYVYAAQRAGDGGLIVRVSRPEAAVFAVSTVLLLELGGAVALCILVSTWLAISLQRRWIEPVRRLAAAAEHMAAGEWDTRVEPAGEHELRAFSTKLNDVAIHAEQHLRDLRRQKSEFISLVDSLPDPILLTDRQQRIVIINRPAGLFLQVTPQQASGVKLIALLGEPGLVDLYEDLPEAPGEAIVRDLRIVRVGQKFNYQVVAVRTATGGALLVLRDVSKLVSAVQMKTDFVANASHELRTPIAAIKLAFDTLAEVYVDDPQQTARCIQIIAGHLQRLEDMLADLLDLSRVENENIKPEIAHLLVNDALAIVRSTMTPLAANKGVSLHIETEESLPMYTDRRLLNLVFKNLIENAIKYTPAGGSVRVALRREPTDDSSAVVLQVIDSGIGIPPQHLERVFERFYQVDSARSGSTGRGTGLGLAIVKHAVHALDGQVHLESLVGRGTTVTCTFPNLSKAITLPGA